MLKKDATPDIKTITEQTNKQQLLLLNINAAISGIHVCRVYLDVSDGISSILLKIHNK